MAPHIPRGAPSCRSPSPPSARARTAVIDGKKLLSYRVQVFQHVAGYVATDRRGVDLDNSQANTHHTPLRWRHECQPVHVPGHATLGMETEPPCVELWPYVALGGRIDYVVVWGATPAAARDSCGGALLQELASGYERVYVSPRGMLQLFRPRAGGRSAEPPPDVAGVTSRRLRSDRHWPRGRTFSFSQATVSWSVSCGSRAVEAQLARSPWRCPRRTSARPSPPRRPASGASLPAPGVEALEHPWPRRR